MKAKQSFSTLDYYLFLLDEYRDRLTLIVSLNLLVLFLGSKFNDYFSTIYLTTNYTDVFGFLSYQSDMLQFYEALFYCYIIAFIIQLAGAKVNKTWVYALNGWILFLSSSYYWYNLSWESLLDTLKSKNYIFYFALLFQLIFYVIFINQLFKNRANKPKINHS